MNGFDPLTRLRNAPEAPKELLLFATLNKNESNLVRQDTAFKSTLLETSPSQWCGMIEEHKAAQNDESTPVTLGELNDESCTETSDDAIPASWPTLSSAALHGLAGDVVEAATRHSEADPAAVLFTFLSTSGIAFGRSAAFAVGDTDHHSRLFVALTGESSRARKGTSADPVRKLFDKLSFPSNLKVDPLRIRPGPLSSGEGILDAIRDDVCDAKGEVELEGFEDKRLMIIDGELGAALRAVQRQGNTLSATIRSLWDGGNIEPLTKTSKLSVTEPHVGFVGHITKAELLPLLKKTDIWNGFANRILWVCARRTKHVAFPEPMAANVVAELAKEVAQAITLAQRATDPIALSVTGREMWAELYPTLTKDHGGTLGVVTARAEAQVLRLALIYTLLDCEDEIGTAHLEAAVAAWNYALASAAFIFGGQVIDPTEQKILSALRDGPLSTNEIRTSVLANHADGLKETLERLQGTGQVTCVSQKTAGRPRTTWQLMRDEHDV